MAAFNILHTTVRCPNCATSVPLELQFRYGDTWQRSYHVGDTIRWGGNDVGTPGEPEVRIEALGGPCPHCGADDLAFSIVLEHDVIRRVEPVDDDRRSAGS